ncbi:MAG: hypothetical protein K0S42_1700, partial [Microvirga sp.]|nr:hypothetical protein [Microvirga sp.]
MDHGRVCVKRWINRAEAQLIPRLAIL